MTGWYPTLRAAITETCRRITARATPGFRAGERGFGALPDAMRVLPFVKLHVAVSKPQVGAIAAVAGGRHLDGDRVNVVVPALAAQQGARCPVGSPGRGDR